MIVIQAIFGYIPVFAFISIIAAFPVSAMDFRTVIWRGHEVIRATGKVLHGDVDLLRTALDSLAPLPHGLPVVLLDSPGGNVSAALEVSAMLDENPVHMVIPDGAKCASACASILFIAGEFRTVEIGGSFGQHSCSYRGLPDSECNELISLHALENGVAYGSVAAFINYTPPSDILWLSRERVDCWGISRYPFDHESGFVSQMSDPCVIEALTGNIPPAQSGWRVDFFEGGYRAFLRPYADHQRELQLNLYCDESQPKKLFLSMEIGGSSALISSVINRVVLEANPVNYPDADYTLTQFDPVFSSLIIEIAEDDVMPFLTKADALSLSIHVKPPYNIIQANTYLSKSRKALIFVANNCIMGSAHIP